MGILVQKASSFLSPYIKEYWALNHIYDSDLPYTHRIIPCGFPELMFFFKDVPESIDRAYEMTSRSVISGQKSTFCDLNMIGKQDLFSIVFNPLGLRMFFNLPMFHFQNQNTPLQEIDPHGFSEIEDKLSGTIHFQDRISIVEKYLFSKLKNSAHFYLHNRLLASLESIKTKKSNVKIPELSRLTCYSRKQFERHFIDWIGLSPKQFLKTIRFQHVLFEKSQNNALSLTELSYKCGYYDQSHMISDFKQFCGITPSKYFSRFESFSDFFHEAYIHKEGLS